jgi:hypothetical protein
MSEDLTRPADSLEPGQATAHGARRAATLLPARPGANAVPDPDQPEDLAAEPVRIRTKCPQHLHSDTFTLTDDCQQDMLGPDMVVSQIQGLVQGKLQHLLGARGEGDMAGNGLLALADDLPHLPADAVEGNAHALKGPGGNTFTLADQTQQEVFGTNTIVAQQMCLVLGKDHGLPGTISKPLKHFATLLAATYLDATSRRAPRESLHKSSVQVLSPEVRHVGTRIPVVTAGTPLWIFRPCRQCRAGMYWKNPIPRDRAGPRLGGTGSAVEQPRLAVTRSPQSGALGIALMNGGSSSSRRRRSYWYAAIFRSEMQR